MGNVPIKHIGCNTRITDRFHKDYKLKKGEKILALFCVLLTTFGSLFMLFSWMLEVATN